MRLAWDQLGDVGIGTTLREFLLELSRLIDRGLLLMERRGADLRHCLAQLLLLDVYCGCFGLLGRRLLLLLRLRLNDVYARLHLTGIGGGLADDLGLLLAEVLRRLLCLLRLLLLGYL